MQQWSKLTIAQAIVLVGVAVAGVALAALWKPMGITKETFEIIVGALALLPIGTWFMSSPLDKHRKPPTDGGAAIGLIFIAAVIGAVHTTGCSDSPISAQARVASALAVATQVAGDQVDDALDRRIAELEQQNAQLGVEAQLAALDTEELHWQPVMHALDAIRDALRSWEAILQLARTAGTDGTLPEIARVAGRIVQLYGRLVDVAADHQITLPDLPPSVTAIAAAVAGGV